MVIIKEKLTKTTMSLAIKAKSPPNHAPCYWVAKEAEFLIPYGCVDPAIFDPTGQYDYFSFRPGQIQSVFVGDNGPKLITWILEGVDNWFKLADPLHYDVVPETVPAQVMNSVIKFGSDETRHSLIHKEGIAWVYLSKYIQGAF